MRSVVPRIRIHLQAAVISSRPMSPTRDSYQLVLRFSALRITSLSSITIRYHPIHTTVRADADRRGPFPDPGRKDCVRKVPNLRNVNGRILL